MKKNMPLGVLPPIYLKQLGVASFMFATGCSLALDRRPPAHVAFNRLFEVYLFGIPFALILSAIAYPVIGRVLVSNYVPYLGGVNVLFDFFPANPTSWFIGTYIHVILLWTLVLRRVPITPRLIAVVLLAEIATRAILMRTAGLYVAYMLLPNWATVFLLGCLYARRPSTRLRLLSSEAVALGLLLVAGLYAWWMYGPRLPFEPTFPFMRLDIGRALVGALVVSAVVSLQYAGITRLIVVVLEPFGAPRFVRFIARNTLVVFLAHMPVFYVLEPALVSMGVGVLLSRVILLIVLLPGLALLSEILHKIVQPRALRESLLARFVPVRTQPAQV